jgi:type IV pilus assembly protein PilA
VGHIRVRSESGFTLLEILVVVLVLGVLAAIALPAFLSQQVKGKDAAAKSDARNVASAVSACRHGENSYEDCDTAAELRSEGRGYDWGTAAGQVRVASADADTFSIEAISKGTTDGVPNRFTLRRAANGSITRTCTGTGGCDDDGSW